ETCPRIQLFGSGFGQNGSTWNWGRGPAVWAYAGPVTSAIVTLSHAITIYLLGDFGPIYCQSFEVGIDDDSRRKRPSRRKSPTCTGVCRCSGSVCRLRRTW